MSKTGIRYAIALDKIYICCDHIANSYFLLLLIFSHFDTQSTLKLKTKKNELKYVSE